MKFIPDTSCRLLHLLLLTELFVHSSSRPAHSRPLCGMFRSMISQVDVLAEVSKKLHNLKNKDLIDSLAADIRLTSLPHIRHSAADLLSMKTNTSLSELYVHTQALKVHVDWWITASKDVHSSSQAAEGASAHLLQLDNLVRDSLKWLNEDVPPSPSPPLPVVSTAFDLLRFSVEISERLKVFCHWSKTLLRRLQRKTRCPK